MGFPELIPSLTLQDNCFSIAEGVQFTLTTQYDATIRVFDHSDRGNNILLP